MVRPKQEYWQGKRGKFTEDQDGKQDWEGLDGKIDLHRAREPVQSLAVLFTACAEETFCAQPDTTSPTRFRPATEHLPFNRYY
jgi:hypothetical protein